MIIDSVNELAFVAFDIFDGSSHSSIVKSFDFDLALDSGVAVTLASSTDVFIADLAHDSTHIYE